MKAALLSGAMLAMGVFAVGSTPAAAEVSIPVVSPGLDLPAIQPVSDCSRLSGVDLRGVAETPARVISAETVQTAKGAFCKVVSHVDPAIVVTTYLPETRWTQRYYQAGGVLAGPQGFPAAGSCQAALNGEFVYASSNQRFIMVVGDRDQPGWKPDAQRRIDYAYRETHLTAALSKALIRAYYGQAPRFSYFIGCSEGGREALVEAQRFPQDFDGISAGAPGLLDTLQESTFHIWKFQANTRADGTNILLPATLARLHAAVIAHCDTRSGVQDNLLEDPSACHFDPASMPCPAQGGGGCFTQEEIAAIDRLYAGARDDKGRYLYWGFQRGSEMGWDYPKDATTPNTAANVHALQLAYILVPQATPALADPARITFHQADFDRATALTRLFDAGDTDLRGFAARQGKLILWHGLSDVQIPVQATIAYYRGIRATMGEAATERMVRAFFLPGVGHCGGGDGFDQFDVLSPLMAWVEKGHAPTELLTGKVAPGAEAAVDPATGAAAMIAPYAKPIPALAATRPAYPFPAIAHYTGKGDPKLAANYAPVTRPQSYVPTHASAATSLIGALPPRDYVAVDGEVQPAAQ